MLKNGLCTIASKINGTPKGVYSPISKLHSILAVANLLAHNNKSQICYCGQISLQSAAVNCSFSDTFGANIYFAGDGTRRRRWYGLVDLLCIITSYFAGTRTIFCMRQWKSFFEEQIRTLKNNNKNVGLNITKNIFILFYRDSLIGEITHIHKNTVARLHVCTPGMAEKIESFLYILSKDYYIAGRANMIFCAVGLR